MLKIKILQIIPKIPSMCRDRRQLSNGENGYSNIVHMQKLSVIKVPFKPGQKSKYMENKKVTHVTIAWVHVEPNW
jgi:hypothetical protein